MIVAVFAVLFLIVAFALYVVIRTSSAHEDALELLFFQMERALKETSKAKETVTGMEKRAEDARKDLEGRILAISKEVARLNACVIYSPAKGGDNDEEGANTIAEVIVHTEKAASANKWALVKTKEGESVAHFNQQFFTMVANTDIYHLDDIEFKITAVKRS